jgi:hypothetical protein
MVRDQSNLNKILSYPCSPTRSGGMKRATKYKLLFAALNRIVRVAMFLTRVDETDGVHFDLWVEEKLEG